MSERRFHAPVYADTFTVPSSKSELQRYLICAALADSPTEIQILPGSLCGDVEAAVGCLSALGARMDITDTHINVIPIKRPQDRTRRYLDCRASGAVLRFMMPVCAALGADAVFGMSPELARRPSEPLCRVLEEHGTRVTRSPLSISGTFTGGDIKADGSISSQYISGLLFALSQTGGSLTVTGAPVSAPYIGMTLHALSAFGAGYEISGSGFVFRKGGPLRSPGRVLAGGDWSGAAFLLISGLIGSHPVCVKGLDINSPQGDGSIIRILRDMGAEISISGNSVTAYPSRLHGITVSASDTPDLVPPLAVAAAAASGETTITNIAHLRYKESDRIASAAKLINDLGGKAVPGYDSLTVYGTGLYGGKADSAGDHRIAMSAAAASLICREDVTVTDFECIEKSFPGFAGFIN